MRGGAMAGEQRTSPEFTVTALEATVRLGDGMGRKREARRSHHNALRCWRWHGGDAWLGRADDEHGG